MNDKRKKILMLLSIGLFNLAIVSLGTYALWTTLTFDTFSILKPHKSLSHNGLRGFCLLKKLRT